MRKLMLIGPCAAALVWAAIPAQADVRSYCEAYARNQADMRLTGSAILGATFQVTPEEWEERKTLALADCLALYAPKTGIENVTATAKPKTATAKPRTATAKKSKTVSAKKPKTVTAKKPRLELLARRTSPAQQDSSNTDTVALVSGSAAWKDYCAAKYTSFNRETGTYTSRSGKQRPCRVTAS